MDGLLNTLNIVLHIIVISYILLFIIIGWALNEEKKLLEKHNYQIIKKGGG